MSNVPFNLDALNIGELLLSNDELLSIDAGATIEMPPVYIPAPTVPSPGYTEATIIWSQIP